jgi:hypothetical protein
VLPFLFLLQAAAVDAPKPPPPPAPTETLHKIVVDAIRNCAQPITGEVVVCAKDRGIAEGYRIPKMDERFAKNLRPSGRGEIEAVDLGIGGLNTCSKVGAAGAIGCTKNEINTWAAEQRLKREAGQPPKDK